MFPIQGYLLLLTTALMVGGSLIYFFLSQRQCLSLLVRLAGTDRARYLKQMEESVAPGDPADKREEMELAMQQV